MYDGFEGEAFLVVRAAETLARDRSASDGRNTLMVPVPVRSVLVTSVVEDVFEQVEVLSHVIDDNVEDEVEGEGLVGCIMGNDSV